MKQVRKGKIVAMVGFLGLFAGVLLVPAASQRKKTPV